MEECRLCSSGRVNKLRTITSVVNGFDYTFFKCNECGSRFFNHDEHEVDLQKMYDSFHSRADFPLEFTPDKKWSQESDRITNYLKRELQSILDVGCRTGDFLLHFPGKVDRIGIEVGKEFAGIAEKRGLTIYNDFLENIEFSESFDVVTCYAILEHLKYPSVFLDSLASLIKDDGILAIMIPTFQSIKPGIYKLFNKSWHMYSPPEHLNYFSRKYLDSFMKSRGFVRISRRYSSGGMRFYASGPLRIVDEYVSFIIDHTFLNKLPIFDHMYSYYRKEK